MVYDLQRALYWINKKDEKSEEWLKMLNNIPNEICFKILSMMKHLKIITMRFLMLKKKSTT